MRNNRLMAIEYEKYVASQLELQGFRGVTLTPKSGDFGSDILCFDLYGQSCSIQCKLYSKPVGYKAIEESLAGAKYYNCNRAIVITNTGFTKQAKIGASKLGVELFICHF